MREVSRLLSDMEDLLSGDINSFMGSCGITADIIRNDRSCTNCLALVTG